MNTNQTQVLSTKATSELLNKLKETSLVPLFYHNNLEVCKQLIDACYKGGVGVIEFTNRGDMALPIYKELLTWIQNDYPDLILGIGTIKTQEQALQFLEAGAQFIVAPVIDMQVGKLCHQCQIPWIPGCGTLTEMYQATILGATLVKAFPIHVLGGASFVKSVLAPCPELNIMASGGIDSSKLAYDTYKNAGAFCVGVGSSLFIKKPNGNFDLQAITQTCKTILRND